MPPEILAVLVGVPLLVAIVEIALQRVGRVLIRVLVGAAKRPEGEGKDEEGFHRRKVRRFSRLL